MSKIPEKIKIGDVEYTVKDNPELLNLMQIARTEEKDKLYSTMSANEAKIKVLEDEKKSAGTLSATKEAELKKAQDELAVSKAEKEKLEAQIKANKGGKGGEEDDDEAKKKAKASGLSKEDMQEAIDNALKKQKEEYEAKLAEVQGGLNKKNVGDYRKEQLAKYKDVIIEGLVPEDLDTEEKVNKAIEKALVTSKDYIRKEYEIEGKKTQMTVAEYEKYEADSKTQGKVKSKKTDEYVPVEPAKKAEQGGGDVTGKDLLKDIATMTDEEYAKHHATILKEVKSIKYEDQSN